MTVSIVLFGLVLYTYLLYPLIVAFLAKGKGSQAGGGEVQNWPSVSVLVTGHNIAHLVDAKLDNLSNIQYSGTMSVFFVLDGCTDRTAALVLERAGSGYPFELSIVESPVRNGKESALRKAIDLIQSDVLVFSDADAFLEGRAIEALVTKLISDPRIGAVSGREIHEKTGNSGASEGQGLFYRYEEFVKRNLERISSLCYVQGGNFAMWRKLYPATIPAGATQDGVIAFEIVKRGYRVAYEERAVSREEYNLSNQADFSRRVRTVSRAFFSILSRPDSLNPFRCGGFGLHVMSARVLRWLAGPIAIAALIAGLLSGPIWYKSLLAIGAVSWGALLAYGWSSDRRGKRVKLPYFVFYFSYIHWAAAMAVWSVLRGKRTTVWKPSG